MTKGRLRQHSHMATRIHYISHLTKLALDESQSLRAIDGNILLVVVGIAAVAAIGVLRVAVGLDDGWVGRRALVTTWASSELGKAASAGNDT